MNATTPSLTDTHAHLDFDQFAGEEAAVVERAAEAGVERIITVGTTLARSRRSVELAGQLPNVYAAVGIHPSDASEAVDGSETVRPAVLGELQELAAADRVVAIGEIGFDFYHLDNPDQAVQLAAFKAQAGIAAAAGLPLILHSREAEALTVQSLAAYVASLDQDAPRPTLPGVVHCFTGSQAFAEQVLGLGFYISFTAPIGYPSNDALREVVKYVPLDRLMVETDCPFLAPQGKRGQRNEPAYVVSTARLVAELKGLDYPEVAARTTANAERLFGLPAAG